MPRIDPLLLLKTLSVLLGPDGGIKESEDVQRVVNLMVRFSKKLVSKCIYVQILLATKHSLLDSFYTHGGWELVTGWFTDGCERDNWRLLEDMLHLFKMSPVTVERLKTNQCPKQVKHLSKDAQCDVVKELALEVVDLWMKVIKGEPKDKKRHSIDSTEEADANNWKMEIRNGICVLKKVDADASAIDAKEEPAAGEADKKAVVEEECDNGEVKQEGVEAMDTSENTDNTSKPNVEEEDGKPEKVEENGEKDETDSISEVKKTNVKKTEVTEEKKDSQSKTSKSKKREHSSSRSESKRKSDSGGDKHKSSSKKSNSSSSSSSKRDNKKSSSRHSSKDSSRHRDHRSRESEKQRERDKEKEREKRKQSEKDKETLALVTGKGTLGRLGAIPKKAPGTPDSKPVSSLVSDSKAAPSAGAGPTAKKVAPEPRKPTAKVFGAKFRSTGLLDAAPTSVPPKKKPEPARPKPAALPKRPLPEPTLGTTAADKRQRIEQRPPVERPGGIKIIPPKPLQLQEASGFMDALNSSKAEKKKSVRRVRRLSSKEDEKKPPEDKKPEDKTEEDTPEEKKAPTPTSPVTKPLLRFYQDTQAEMEEEEEKERQKESEAQEETPADGDAAPPKEDDAAEKPADTAEKPADAPQEEEEEPQASPPTIPLERRSSQDPGRPRGVLVYHRSSSRRKLSVSWKPERQLVSVQYFELDQNERVNVNRAKFLEMQTMEKTRERELMRRARMERDDGMSEQMPWQMLIVVDRPPALVAPGARSHERAAQEQRELTALPAFFVPHMLPESPAEPDPELHPPTPCKPVPLDDDQGDLNVKDFSPEGWPEPKPEPRHLAGMQGSPHLGQPGLLPAPPQQHGWGPEGPMHPDMGVPMEEDMPRNMMIPDLMSNTPVNIHPGPGYGGPQMMPPGGGWAPMGGHNMMAPGPMMGPPAPNMMMMPGPGPHFNNGGGPAFRGGGRGGWRSAAEDTRPLQREVLCRHFSNGHCRKGMSCNFLHSAPPRSGGGGRSGRGRGGGRGWKDRPPQHEFV